MRDETVELGHIDDGRFARRVSHQQLASWDRSSLPVALEPGQ
jgi:hypothetical protein